MSTFEAYRLVMIKIKCDFCEENDGTGVIFVTPSFDRLYGVQACPDCIEYGKNSLESSLDKIGAVDSQDFYRIPEIIKFVNLLTNGDFPTMRTNGDIEYDWKLDTTSPFMRSEKGWFFKIQRDDSLKSVYFSKFIEMCHSENQKNEDETKKLKITELISSCEKALEILNNGFYGILFEKKYGFRF